METVQVHSWSQSTDVHLWLCRVQHAPEERHPLPHDLRKLTDADVFYLVNELNNLESYATFTDEKNKALILFRWLCHLLAEEGCPNELPCMADRPLAKRLHVHCVKARGRGASEPSIIDSVPARALPGVICSDEAAIAPLVRRAQGEVTPQVKLKVIV